MLRTQHCQVVYNDWRQPCRNNANCTLVSNEICRYLCKYYANVVDMKMDFTTAQHNRFMWSVQQTTSWEVWSDRCLHFKTRTCIILSAECLFKKKKKTLDSYSSLSQCMFTVYKRLILPLISAHFTRLNLVGQKAVFQFTLVLCKLHKSF